MDILSIRKKGKKPPKKEESSSPASSSPPASSSSSRAEAAPASSPPSALPPLPPARAHVSNPTIIDDAPPAAMASAAPGTSTGKAVATDPLRGFLAMFDNEDDGDGDGLVKAPDASDSTQRFLSFRLLDEEYAASIMDIREILTIRSLTEVPRAPKEVLGVVSKRGVVLPVIDLATSLNLRPPERRLRAAQRVLVVGDGDRVCGLRVDAVSEVIKLQTSQIEEVPASLGQKNAGLLLGLGRAEGNMYILLDVAAVLDAFAIAMGVAPTPRTES